MPTNASEDHRLLGEYLGWSREAARLERLLTDGTPHSRSELQRALDAVWSLLPPGEPFQPYRAALLRLVDAYDADRPASRPAPTGAA